jgi:hypothetical protein
MASAVFPAPSSSGIPTGTTGERPSNPSTGNVFYDGTVGALMMYDGATWIPSSAPTAQPTIAVVDVGTGVAYGSAQGAVTFTEQTSGGNAIGYTVSSSTGGYSATSTSNNFNITVGNSGSWTFSGTAYNAFGISAASPSVTQTLTTLPQSPTIGTTTASTTVSELTVNWTLNNNGGKPLTSITIIPYLNGVTAQTPVNAASTSSTSHTFTNLTVDALYTFKVKTTNENGDSILSNASNQIAVPSFFNADYFVLAGGGGGGASDNVGGGGGGGAGGLRSTILPTGGGASAESQITLAKNTNYTVTVGAGGPSRTSGSNSVFYSVTSTGGGRGGYYDGIGGASGGSGGGGGGGDGSPGGGGGTTGQGRNGGSGIYNPSGNYRNGGGGGGAGGVGSNCTSTAGGNGGPGVTSTFDGNTVTYAGGGGGASNIGTQGTAGSGGGGAVNGAGTANRGGGGGGCSFASSSSGGVGGSGIVHIKYPDSKTITIGAGLTGVTGSPSGGYKITTITAGTGNVSFA